MKDRLRFLMNNKKLVPRLVKNYFLIYIMNEKRLRTVELALTYSCSCNCEHCYATEYGKAGCTELTIKELKEAVDMSISHGAVHFLLTGGEPLLSEKLYPIIDYIKHKGGIVSLATNGIKLDDDATKNLSSGKVDLVEVSMDFPSPEKHSRFRKISHKNIDIWKNIIDAKSAGLNIRISILAQKAILKDEGLLKLIRKAKNRKIQSSLCFPCTLGNWSQSHHELLDQNDFRYITRQKKKHSITSCEDNSYLRAGCSAGTEKIYVSAYGDVTPCPLIPIKFGNIREESLDKILAKMRKNKYFSSIHPRCLPASDKAFIKGLVNRK